MESADDLQEKGWSLCNLPCRCFVSLYHQFFPHPSPHTKIKSSARQSLPNRFPSACFSSLIRLYYSVRLAKSDDLTYHVGLLGLWSLPEMASGFLAMCLPVSPRFCQSLKKVEIPSFISISRPCLSRFSKSDGYLTQSNSPSGLPKKPTLLPEKEASPPPRRRSASLVSGQPALIDGSSSYTKLEPGNSHILRCIEISTTNEPIDARTPVFPINW